MKIRINLGVTTGHLLVTSVRPDIRFRFRFRPIFSNPVPVPAKFWPDWPDSLRGGGKLFLEPLSILS